MFELMMNDKLEFCIWYFGWRVSKDVTVTEFTDIKSMTITQWLTNIENLHICPGLNFLENDGSLNLGQKHITTEPADIRDDIGVPKVITLAYR